MWKWGVAEESGLSVSRVVPTVRSAIHNSQQTSKVRIDFGIKTKKEPCCCDEHCGLVEKSGASAVMRNSAAGVAWNILRSCGKPAVVTLATKNPHTTSTKSPHDSHAMFTAF